MEDLTEEEKKALMKKRASKQLEASASADGESIMDTVGSTLHQWALKGYFGTKRQVTEEAKDNRGRK